MSNSVLLVDDEQAMLNMLERIVPPMGFECDTALGGPAAIAALDRKRYDAVLCDLMMPEVDGFGVIEHALRHGRAGAVIILTAAGSIPLAVQAMRAGAADLLTKPFDRAILQSTLKRVCAGQPMSEDPEFGAWRQKFAPDLVGNHPTLVEALSIVQRVAPTDVTVLVMGQSGTGKELFARAIHNASGRDGKPFVALNCAAIPKDLIESELFGHVKGAFTGATDKREGKFQAAEGGTRCLAEIGEMHLDLQAKLLRVLQEREYTPIGESRPRKTDVRVIAATNRDLLKRVQEGAFREDLYYRLNVIPLELPSLCDRPDDIVPLARHFIRWANQRHGRTVASLDPAVESAFRTYKWPGNVREMQNLVERLVILSRGSVITGRDIPAHMAGATPASAAPKPTPIGIEGTPVEGMKLDEALENLERRLTLDALQKSGGNKAKAAEMLGLKRTTLVERLKKLNITVDE